jgi:uncharacterized protein YbjQ (UPF0145 family)
MGERESEQAAQAFEEQEIARLERGGLPSRAEQRLRELGGTKGAFTSDLSVADFALCHRVGLRPLAQVMGSSIYQVGYQTAPWPAMLGGGAMFELQVLSEAWNEVRTRALGRLAQEAQLVGADAVVGVELRAGRYDWAENAIEYMLVGTAVCHEHASEQPGGPVVTELSVADYVKLAQAQIEPLGVVAWSSVFFVSAAWATQMLGRAYTRNMELPEFTQGVYGARETVVARMSAQAAELRASGVIGVRIDHAIEPTSLGGGRYENSGLMVSFHAIGTAIREPAQVLPAPPRTTVDLTS